MIKNIATFKNDVVAIVYWKGVPDTMLSKKVIKQKIWHKIIVKTVRYKGELKA